MVISTRAVMKITPIEIRQHSFEKAMRGYRTDEVEAFLASLSQEWERVLSEQKMLKMQLELAEKERNELKEIQQTLFKMLKTAEDTSSQITEQAQRAAEQYLNEAKQKADEQLADARKRSTLMVQDAENQARYIKDNVLTDLKTMEYDFKAMERYKESLISQIRTLAANAVESVDRFEKKFNQQSLQSKIEELSVSGETPEISDELLVDPTAPRLDEADHEAKDPSELVVDPTAPDLENESLSAEENKLSTDIGDPVTAQADEAGEAGFPFVESTNDNDTLPQDSTDDDVPADEKEPQPAHEATAEKPKSGGSFFDQI